MAKKNSMYMNDYEVVGYYTENTIEESKEEYLNYIQSLIDDLQNLKNYAENEETDVTINMFKDLQLRLVTLKNNLNAKLLSAWHNNYTYALQKEVEKLRRENNG